MRLTIANIKGGVGKTTIATNFACISAFKGKKTILIDSDVQGSSMKFRALRAEKGERIPQFIAVSILTPTVHKDIDGFTADIIYVDAGGLDSKLFRSSIMASDAILVPLLPSQYDLWSSEETFKLIDEIRTFKAVKVGVIINQVIAGTAISREVLEIMKDYIEKYKLTQFESILYSRVAYKESVSEGLAVTEFIHTKYKKAKEEMFNLYNEVLKWVSKN